MSAGDKSDQLSTRWQLVLAHPPGIFWCNKSFFSANHLTSWKMGHFSRPSPPLCCSLTGEEWERKGEKCRGGDDLTGVVLYQSSICCRASLLDILSWHWHRTCNGRDKSMCVCVCEWMWAGREGAEKFSWRGLQLGWVAGSDP